MRHSFQLFALAVGLTLTAVGCTNASAGTGSSGPGAGPADARTPIPDVDVDTEAAALLPAGIKSRGALVVASDASYRPFEYIHTDNKTMVGFDIDLTDAVGARLGLEVKHVNAGFDSILPGLAARKYDVGASAFSITPQRSRNVDFVPYLRGGTGIAVKAGNPHGLKMEPMSLCGHPVAAQKGAIQGLEQLPKISKKCTAAGKPPVTIDLFPSQDGANLAVVSGRDHAVVGDPVPLAIQAKASGGRFEPAPGLYEPDIFGLAVSKGSPLKPALDAGVKSLLNDDGMDALNKKWDMPGTTRLETGS